MVAARLAGPGRRAAAVARMPGGLAAANVLGVPAAVLVSGWFDWRASFVLVVAVGGTAT